MRDLNNQPCDRSDDLIAFLYRELNDHEAQSFERHLHECGSCERELSSFGEIRQSIVSWRDASLAAAWSPAAENESRVTVPALQPRVSSFAAIREFFNLSPLWLKGAMAFASLLFCICAALAIAYLKAPVSTQATLPTDKVYSQKELDKQVAAAELKKEQQLRDEFAKNSTLATSTTDVKPAPHVVQQRTASYAVNTRNLRKPLTRQERNEIAADLGLLTSRDDDDIDLITDRITQTPLR